MGWVRRAAVGVGTATVLAATLLGFAPAATADDGITVAARSTYELDPAASAVLATVTLDLENVTPNQVTSDGVYSYVFTAFSVPVPAGATSLRASSRGDPLQVRLVGTDDPSTSLARVGFPNLGYGQSRRIVLTFSVPGAPPRSTNTTRVGPGYATFLASSPGDAGHNEVRVVVPAGMTFTSTSDDFTRSTSGSSDTWTTTTNTTDAGIWTIVSVRDPASIDERSVTVAGTPLVLESFPGDSTWSDFVEGVVTDGIPTLERLVGTSWPGGLQRIREDASPQLRGYDGWFDPGDDEIVVSEALDQDLILHELSHAWLSSERFGSRWQYEGLAQVVAERAVRASDGTPFRHPEASPSDSAAVPLNEWGGGAGTRSTGLEGWAYPASYQATKALLGGLDDKRFAAVVAAGIAGERAYDPPGTPDHTGGRTTWQRWLDLVQNRGGVEDAASVYSTWILTPAQAKELSARAAARAAYASLDDADGAWLPPEGLRDAMTSWDFERAGAVRAEVEQLGPEAAGVQDAASAAGLEVPDTVRESYEDAAFDEQYVALSTSLPAAARTISVVGDAASAAAQERDPFSSLGAAVLRLDEGATHAVALLGAGDLDGARAGAEEVVGRAGWALPLGIGLPVVALLLVVGAVLLVVVLVRRRGSENPEHPGVAERVGLDPLEVEELRDPLVVGAQQLGVDRRVDGLPLDRGEAVPPEERGLEGQAEQPGQAEVVGPFDEPAEQARPDAPTEEGRGDREGAHLPEVLPEHVERAAADDDSA